MCPRVRVSRLGDRRALNRAGQLGSLTRSASATDPRNAHHDGRNRRPAGDSFLTALLYLNGEGESLEGEEGEPLEGGHTLFLSGDGDPVARVAPRKGSLLLFDHHLYHRGEGVRRGTKFCLRSDLLYQPFDSQTGELMSHLL